VKTEIRGGAVIETATPAEVKKAIDAGNADWFRERARGVQHWRFESEPVTVSGGAVTLPSANNLKCGPNPGFCVLVTALRVLGLSSGDVLSVYRNTVNSVPVEQFVMPSTGTIEVITCSSKSLFLFSDERLIFQGSGLMATGDIRVTAEGFECPAPDVWKLTG